MGWKCKKCGNTKKFVEINTIKTIVNQDKETTKVLETYDFHTGEGCLRKWCDKCGSKDVEWIENEHMSNKEYHKKEIKDPQKQFDSNEVTVSHFFRYPHPALENRTYAGAFLDALVKKNIFNKNIARVIEIGGGLGYFARGFLEQLKNTHKDRSAINYVLVDLSPKLTLAQTERNSGSENTDYMIADALEMPLGKSTNTLFICNEVIADFDAVLIDKDTMSSLESPTPAFLRSLECIHKYNIDIEDAPQKFYFNLGAIEFLEEMNSIMDKGSVLVVVEYGSFEKYPILRHLKEHDECSINFKHLKTAAEKIGFDVTRFDLKDFLGINMKIKATNLKDKHILKKSGYDVGSYAYTDEMLKDMGVKKNDMEKLQMPEIGSSKFSFSLAERRNGISFRILVLKK